jgi:hypothetical protein
MNGSRTPPSLQTRDGGAISFLLVLVFFLYASVDPSHILWGDHLFFFRLLFVAPSTAASLCSQSVNNSFRISI